RAFLLGVNARYRHGNIVVAGGTRSGVALAVVVAAGCARHGGNRRQSAGGGRHAGKWRWQLVALFAVGVIGLGGGATPVVAGCCALACASRSGTAGLAGTAPARTVACAQCRATRRGGNRAD